MPDNVTPLKPDQPLLYTAEEVRRYLELQHTLAYTKDEAARLLRLSTGQLQGLIDRGELKSFQIAPRTVRISREALLRFLQGRSGVVANG